jgi:preprotein translocase subunit SecD
MAKLFLSLVSFFTLTNFCFAQETKIETTKVATLSDTSKYSFSAGFYLAIPGTSKKGFQLLNSNDFYYIRTEYSVTLRNIDSVYKEFDRNYKLYVLKFKFDTVGTKELLDFTMKYQGQKIGLLLNNKLISVGSLYGPIEYGVMTLVGNFTETEINAIKIEIENAIKELKVDRGTIRRKIT